MGGGAFQFADAAVCLNVSQDHLDRYPDRLNYAWHKSKIYCGSKLQVINEDDVFCQAMRQDAIPSLGYSLSEKADYWLNITKSEHWLMYHDTPLININSLKLKGLHNVANVMAALALCSAIEVNQEYLIDLLPFFEGLAHRMQKIAEINSVSFIDDSKGTNVGATVAALQGAPVPVVLIAGGLAKGQSFEPLKKWIKEKVVHVCLIGEATEQIAAVLQDSDIPITRCNSLPEATYKAYSVAPPHSWVLLSPACASMDMFEDYAHRSAVFKEAIEELADEE